MRGGVDCSGMVEEMVVSSSKNMLIYVNGHESNLI